MEHLVTTRQMIPLGVGADLKEKLEDVLNLD